MVLRDYFHLFSTVPEKSEAYDFLLQFIGDQSIDLLEFPTLTKICDWATYNEHSFRIWTSLPLTEFEAQFSQLTGVSPQAFNLDYSYNFKDNNFF